MNALVHPREKSLGTLTLVLGLLVWALLILGTFGMALVGLGVGYLVYLFTHSALIAYVKGNGVELSEAQFPDLFAQFRECCDGLEVRPRPRAYVLNGDGGLNAFATRFLGTEFVVLLADVVDAMDEHPDGVRFYMGHELGHLRMKHLTGQLLRWPVLWLPLLGAAYSRARESTCDRHGLACCSSPDGAARALAALSVGVRRWQSLDLDTYLLQAKDSGGFWMSFHELVSGYPWLSKRAARVVDPNIGFPSRPFFTYVLGAFVPYAGRLGAGFGFIIMLYILAVLTSVGLPAYVGYVGRAQVAGAIAASEGARDKLAEYYLANETPPETLGAAGLGPQLAGGAELRLNPEGMVLTVHIERGDVIFTPRLNEDGAVDWECTNGEGLKPAFLPDECVTSE